MAFGLYEEKKIENVTLTSFRFYKEINTMYYSNIILIG